MNRYEVIYKHFRKNKRNVISIGSFDTMKEAYYHVKHLANSMFKTCEHDDYWFYFIRHDEDRENIIGCLHLYGHCGLKDMMLMQHSSGSITILKANYLYLFGEEERDGEWSF